MSRPGLLADDQAVHPDRPISADPPGLGRRAFAAPPADDRVAAPGAVPRPRASAALVAAAADAERAATADVVELVARAQAGDAEAFGALYDRYVDLVHRYVHYRVPTAALAEDLVSETFLRALRRIGTFSWQGRDFGAWLVTIARNLITDHVKSSRFRLEVSTADMLDADRAGTAMTDDQALAGITHHMLLTAVTRLGPEQQECVVLRFLHGLSVAETALAMGKSDGAIKALQYRAMQALRRLLPEDLNR